MKDKTVQNYLVLIFIFIATIGVAFYMISYYQKRVEYEKSFDTRMNFLSQLKPNEITNYITENHEAFIYISNSSDDQYAVYEKQLKKFLIAKEMTKDIVYVDVNQMDYNILGDFKTYWDEPLSSMPELSLPNVLVVTEGKISEVLYQTGQEKNVKDVIRFLESHINE